MRAEFTDGPAAAWHVGPAPAPAKPAPYSQAIKYPISIFFSFL